MSNSAVPYVEIRGRGTYLLVASLAEAAELPVGRLGTFALPSGWYAYAGSALGPGGIGARLGRHLRPDKRLHWHVDYLLRCSIPVMAWYTMSLLRLECAWAASVRQLPGAQLAVPRFGASDCRCPGHLARLPNCFTPDQIASALRAAAQGLTVLAGPCAVQSMDWSTSTARGRSIPLRAHAASTDTYNPPATRE